ncbi:MAG: hypothetical protein WC091_14970 [Sulfuricellaceae bacterium]
MKFAKKILASSLIAFSLISGASEATADTASTVAASYNLASHGIQLSLQGAINWFTDLNSAVKALDPNGNMQLLSNGALAITVLGTTYQVVPQPGCASTNVPTSPHITVSNGQINFFDRYGSCTILVVVG